MMEWVLSDDGPWHCGHDGTQNDTSRSLKVFQEPSFLRVLFSFSKSINQFSHLFPILVLLLLLRLFGPLSCQSHFPGEQLPSQNQRTTRSNISDGPSASLLGRSPATGPGGPTVSSRPPRRPFSSLFGTAKWMGVSSPGPSPCSLPLSLCVGSSSCLEAPFHCLHHF